MTILALIIHITNLILDNYLIWYNNGRSSWFFQTMQSCGKNCGVSYSSIYSFDRYWLDAVYGPEVVLYIFLLHVYRLLLLRSPAGSFECLTLELISPIACGPFVFHGKVCLNAEGYIFTKPSLSCSSPAAFRVRVEGKDGIIIKRSLSELWIDHIPRPSWQTCNTATCTSAITIARKSVLLHSVQLWPGFLIHAWPLAWLDRKISVAETTAALQLLRFTCRMSHLWFYSMNYHEYSNCW